VLSYLYTMKPQQHDYDHSVVFDESLETYSHFQRVFYLVSGCKYVDCTQVFVENHRRQDYQGENK